MAMAMATRNGDGTNFKVRVSAEVENRESQQNERYLTSGCDAAAPPAAAAA